MRPIFDLPEVGRIAILTEPGGAGVELDHAGRLRPAFQSRKWESADDQS